MKTILKLEELALFLLGIYLFGVLPFAWWWFLVLLLVPDVGMFGYLFSPKLGALTYNLFHHRGLGVAIYFLGIYGNHHELQLAGVILFSHIAMDRALSYGLKYENGFKFTHLGKIGKQD